MVVALEINTFPENVPTFSWTSRLPWDLGIYRERSMKTNVFSWKTQGFPRDMNG
jgi:hypothetical protein